jgi:phage baseplate assembly protein W
MTGRDTAAEASARAFLGIGWRFPLQVTPAGGLARSAFERRIEESVRLILETAPGERVMLPDFGCGIHDLVFAPASASTQSLVVQRVRSALVRWEPRIDVLEITAESAPEDRQLLLIRISYAIRSNNAIGNLVYPFLLREAG